MKSETEASGLLLGWHVVAAAVLLVVPARIVLGEAAWPMEPSRLPAVVGIPLCYLASGIVLRVPWGGQRRANVLRSLVTLAVFLAGFYLALLLYAGDWYSRSLLLSGSMLAASFIVAPILLPRPVLAMAASLLLVVGVGSVVTFRPAGDEVEESSAQRVSAEVLRTSHGTVSVLRYGGHVGPAARGGGLQPLDDGYILATGNGDLFLLEWADDPDTLHVTDLSLRVPLNRDEFTAAVGDEIPPESFRVADLLVQVAADSLRLFGSHHHWHDDGQCFVVRVSTAVVTREELERGGADDRWRTLYDTRPCLQLKWYDRGLPFAGTQMGGRLADLGPDGIVMTVGDFQFDGWYSEEILPQDSSADYGKVLLISTDGEVVRRTMGHRNPQGLLVASDGRIWSTEHGPRGGDALNEIVWGSNYGWPYWTYGTEYEQATWPLQGQGELDEATFRRPLFAWVPSIAISNLIEVRHGPVAEWQGDLLVSSLRAETLYRIRRDGDRVAYVEPMSMGSRIRDIAEGEDGRIVLWTDGGDIISLTASTPEAGAALFAPCAGCHSAAADGESGIGPNLHAIFGRRIGADPTFPYSPALRSMAGRWSAETLDAFLADPQAFAPGTTMISEPMTDAEQRRELIRYLRTLR
jgi:aldose sugar dehydrogenase